MKRNVLTTGACVAIFFFVCGLALHAASNKHYVFDTKEENGNVVSKVIFLQDESGLLSKQMMYAFSYNDAGKVAEKKAYRWDNAREDWEPLYRITYQYAEGSGEIQTNYAMWDKKGRTFSLNVQTLSIPTSDYEAIFS